MNRIVGMEERRQDKRYPLKLPADVQWKAPGKTAVRVRGETGDISSSGILVVIPKRLPLGTTINVTINLPVEITKVPVALTCLGRVVRKSSTGKGQGISAIIEDFQLRPLPLKAGKPNLPAPSLRAHG